MKRMFRSLLLAATILASAVGLADVEVHDYTYAEHIPPEPTLLFADCQLRNLKALTLTLRTYFGNSIADQTLGNSALDVYVSPTTENGVYNYSNDGSTAILEFQYYHAHYHYPYALVIELTQGEDGVYGRAKYWRYGGFTWGEPITASSSNCKYFTDEVEQEAYRTSGTFSISSKNMVASFYGELPKHTVVFKDLGENTISSQSVTHGEAAEDPRALLPEVPGKTFYVWSDSFDSVVSNMTVRAIYHKLCAVTFKDADGTTLQEETVEETFGAKTAPDMRQAMYQNQEFLRWDNDFTYVTNDLVVTAVYGIEEPKLSPVPRPPLVSGRGRSTRRTISRPTFSQTRRFPSNSCRVR